VVLDQVQAGRRPWLGQLPRRCGPRLADLLSDLDDDAVSAARVQEGFLPGRIGQVDADRLDAERSDPGQRVLDVVDHEVEMVRARAAGAQEPLQEGRVGTPGGRQQLDFRARGELQLAPPVPGRVAAVGPAAAEDPTEQVPAVGQDRGADGKVIEYSGHLTSRNGRGVPSQDASDLATWPIHPASSRISTRAIFRPRSLGQPRGKRN